MLGIAQLAAVAIVGIDAQVVLGRKDASTGHATVGRASNQVVAVGVVAAIKAAV